MLNQAKPIKIAIPSQGTETLKPTDHVASGGEGAVYRKGGRVFKLYLSPERAIASGMEEKIKLLSAIRHPNIVAPQSAIFDPAGSFIGYMMPFCDGMPLTKTFTNTWRDQNGFGVSESASLAENMRLAVGEVHRMKALMVDANEMNYLVEGVQPRLIDVDSWQIGRFKATAMMPSIRDYSQSQFSTLTDWFAWAVVTFQVFVGLHPYKGSHPDFKRGDLEARMRANASVFDGKVSLNSAVRPLSVIPAHLRDWYEGVFQHGARGEPPSVLASPVAQAPKRVRVRQAATATVRHEMVMTLPFEVRHVSRNAVAYGKRNGEWMAYDLRQRHLLDLTDPEIKRQFLNQAVLVRNGERFALLSILGNEIAGRHVLGEGDPVPAQMTFRPMQFEAGRLAGFDNTPYAITESGERGMVELTLATVGLQTAILAGKSWPLSVNASRFYNGIVLSDMLGTPFATIPVSGAVHTLNAACLRGVAVIDALARGPECVIVVGTDKTTGQTTRYVLKSDGMRLSIVSQEDAETGDINLVVTPKKIAVGIFADDTIQVFSVVSGAAKEVRGAGIAADASLFMVSDMVCYADRDRIFQLSLS